MSRPSDHRDELVVLLGALRDGQITAEQFARLEQWLRQDAAARRFYVRFMTLHASLEQIGSVDAVAEQVRQTLNDEEAVRELRSMIARDMSSGSTSGRHGWKAGGYVAAVLAAAAILAMVYFGKFFTVLQDDTTCSAEIAALYGRVELSGADKAAPSTLGTVVGPGQSLTTGPHAYVRLRYPDGSTIDLNAGTELSLGADKRSKQVTLLQGGIFVAVPPQPHGSPLLVNPGRYDQVRAVGTSFELRRSKAGETRVLVTDGSVVFGVGETTLRVEAGHGSTASPEQEPTQPETFDSGILWQGLNRGLTATYYDNEDLTGKSVTRVDPAIDFDWKKSSPDPAIQADTFSARWTGRIQAQHSEPYTFLVVADGGVRLWVDDEMVIDHWKDKRHSKLTTRPTKLIAGRKHDFKLEYHDQKGAAKVQLWWSSPSTPKAVVPQSQLYPSAELDKD